MNDCISLKYKRLGKRDTQQVTRLNISQIGQTKPDTDHRFTCDGYIRESSDKRGLIRIVGKKKQTNDQRKTKGGGSSQVGSLRAQKILNDESRAALEATLMRDLEMPLGFEQHFKMKDFSRERFSLEIWPLAETSIQKNDTTRDRARSAIREAYFSVL